MTTFLIVLLLIANLVSIAAGIALINRLRREWYRAEGFRSTVEQLEKRERRRQHDEDLEWLDDSESWKKGGRR